MAFQSEIHSTRAHHKDLANTAKRAEGSYILPKVMIGQFNGEITILKLARALEEQIALNERYEKAFHQALDAPKGVIPAGTEDLYNWQLATSLEKSA